jgi:hypothetical protein
VRAAALSATTLLGGAAPAPVRSADPDSAADQLQSATPIKHVIVVTAKTGDLFDMFEFSSKS